MKTAIVLGCLAGALSFQLQAAPPLVLPDYVKQFEELEEAKKLAAKENKGLAFMLMEPGST